ncbi:MAG: elongation factor P [bacterium]
MVEPNKFETGMGIYIDDDLYIVENFQHSKQARGGASVKVKLRDVQSGNIENKRLRPEENFEQAYIDEKEAEFLYRDEPFLVFMDMETYDQVEMSEESLGEKTKYLTEGEKLELKYTDGEPVGIVLPNKVTLEVADTEPGVKGDTAQGGTKPATLTTGLTVDVPLFINEGDLIEVDTEKGEYSGKVEEDE